MAYLTKGKHGISGSRFLYRGLAVVLIGATIAGGNLACSNEATNTAADLVGSTVTTATPVGSIGGEAVIGHPSADIGMATVVTTEWSGVDWIYWALPGCTTRFFAKDGIPTQYFWWSFTETHLGVQPTGVMGNALNDADGGKGNLAWGLEAGLPTGILNYNWQRADSRLKGFAFAWDDAVILRYETKGITEIRLTAKLCNLDGDKVSGAIDSGDPDVVVIDAGSGYSGSGGRYLAVGFSKPDEIYLGTYYQSPITGYDTGSQATNEETTFLGIGSSRISDGETVTFAFAMDDDQEEAARRVRHALATHDDSYRESCRWWRDFLAEVDFNGHTERERYMVSVGLNQIAAHMVGEKFMTAGSYIHPYAWVRDNSFAAMGVSRYQPELAKDIMRFFADVDTVGCGQFGMNGASYGAEAATDRAAIFLWALGEIYRATGDMAWAGEMSIAARANVDYYRECYVAADGHIATEHTHDWWDQYQGKSNIDVSLVRYEAEIDLYAMHAFRTVAPMFADLGDATRAAWLMETSEALQTHIADYLSPDRQYLAYAIKTDGALYLDNDLFTMPTNLFAGLFLEEEKYYQAIITRQQELTAYNDCGDFTGSAMPFSGRPCYATGDTASLWNEAEFYWEIFFAYLDTKWGNTGAYERLHNLNALGIVPIKYQWFQGDITPGSKPVSFPWHYGNLMLITSEVVAERGAVER